MLLFIIGNTVAGIADLLVSQDRAWMQLLSIFGTFVADMESFSSDQTYLVDREGALITGPSSLAVTMIPLIAQAFGIFLAVVFKYAAMNILITVKSFMIRTALLGSFFFLFLPLGKMAVVQTGLSSMMTPSLLSRADGQRNEETLDDIMSPEHMIEFVLSEIFKLAESFFDDIDSLIVS